VEKDREDIFKYAAALDQSGKMKNTILCSEREVFIINFDRTILLSFVLKKTSAEFKERIVFDVNDYESSNFYTKDGALIFETAADGYIKKKKCGTNKQLDFETISKLYYKLSRKKAASHFSLNKAILAFLQDDLSHVEIHYDNGVKIIQRDIFSGTIIEIEKDRSGLFFETDNVEPFEPMGLRLSDLEALFIEDKELSFAFAPGLNYFIVEAKTSGMKGILSWCLFDELGSLGVVGG